MGINAITSFNKRQQDNYIARTGIRVDIQNIGKNKKLIAVKERSSSEELQPGVFFAKESVEFSTGNFTNIYDVSWDQSKSSVTPIIHSADKPYYLCDQIQTDPSILAVINGAFFFLADIADREPLVLQYNLCIQDGQILGLPSSDDPIIYIRDGKLHAKEPQAKGTMLVAGKKIAWVGANSNAPTVSENSILYNSKCSSVVKVRDPKTNVQIGILDSKHITTPTGSAIVDIVVSGDEKGTLRITQINQGGGTHFYSGFFILQMRTDKNTFHVGDIVEPITLDGLDLRTIHSGITTGKRVDDPFLSDPVRVNRRDARSLIAEDVHGKIHFLVFDGSKYVPGFSGVSAKEIIPYFAPDKFKWAYFLDGGGSSRIIVRKKDQLAFLANEFAFRKMENGTFLWDWQRARMLVSSVYLKVGR